MSDTTKAVFGSFTRICLRNQKLSIQKKEQRKFKQKTIRNSKGERMKQKAKGREKRNNKIKSWFLDKTVKLIQTQGREERKEGMRLREKGKRKGRKGGIFKWEKNPAASAPSVTAGGEVGRMEGGWNENCLSNPATELWWEGSYLRRT
jgi:hypothetical protein